MAETKLLVMALELPGHGRAALPPLCCELRFIHGFCDVLNIDVGKMATELVIFVDRIKLSIS